MTRVLKRILMWLVLLTGCGKAAEPLTPAMFTQEFADALRGALPGLRVAVRQDLDLVLTTAAGKESSAFLDNAWKEYQLAPTGRTPVIQRYVAATVAGLAEPATRVDRTRIIPIIKDTPWLAEARRAIESRGGKPPEFVAEEFCPGLTIVYAEDTDKNVSYLTPERLDEAHVTRADLRALAMANLRRIMPKVKRTGSDGVYMLIAGGDYEASLLLSDSLWTDPTMGVRGEVVVAVPARDMLLVTGSRDVAGLAKVRELVTKTIKNGSYTLTGQLFVYRGGKFEPFVDGPPEDVTPTK